MTPVAKKATAAELRAEVLVRMGPGWQSPSDDLLSDLLAAARAEAVAPVLEVLRQLVAACHKCANCESPAMRKAANEALYCDAHGYYLSGTQMDDHRIAAPLRAALALLDAGKAEAGAVKP